MGFCDRFGGIRSCFRMLTLLVPVNLLVRLLVAHWTVTGQSGAVQNASIIPTIPRPSPVQAAAVVIHYEVIRLPLVAVDKLWLCRPLQQFLQQSFTLLKRLADHARHIRAHQQHLSSRLRNCAHKDLIDWRRLFPKGFAHQIRRNLSP